MKNNRKIRLSIFIYFLIISHSVMAVQSSDSINPKNERVLQVLLNGETEIPEGELEKRTFQVGDKIKYSLIRGSSSIGEIIGFSGDDVIIKRLDGLELTLKLSNFSKIRKETKKDKLHRIMQICLLSPSLIGSLIALNKVNNSQDRLEGDNYKDDWLGLRLMTNGIIYLGSVLIFIIVFSIGGFSFFLFRRNSKRNPAFKKKSKQGMNLRIAQK